MIEYKNGKEYWNGEECTANFVYRTLADMYPYDYEQYCKESFEFKRKHTVLQCADCYYQWVYDRGSAITAKNCPSCKSTQLRRL